MILDPHPPSHLLAFSPSGALGGRADRVSSVLRTRESCMWTHDKGINFRVVGGGLFFTMCMISSSNSIATCVAVAFMSSVSNHKKLVCLDDRYCARTVSWMSKEQLLHTTSTTRVEVSDCRPKVNIIFHMRYQRVVAVGRAHSRAHSRHS